MNTAKKVAPWSGAGLLAAASALAALVLWIVNTPAGTAWTIGKATELLESRLSVGAVNGTLAGPLTLCEIRYRDAATGLEVTASRVLVDVELSALLRLRVHVRNAEFQGIDVVLGQSQPDTESQPFSFKAPIDIVVDRLIVGDSRVQRDGAALITVTQAQFSGSWIERHATIEQLDVFSPQGEVHFAADVQQRGADYAGEGRGRFRWQFGERTVAGDLNATGKNEVADLSLKLNSPLDARLHVSLSQTKRFPWQIELDIPRFDPRDALLPNSGLQALSASLRGEGNIDEGTLRGSVNANDVPVYIDPLHFTRSEEQIALAPLRLRVADSKGALEAKGNLLLAEQPLRAELAFEWSDLTLPARIAGQVLETRGSVKFAGGVQSYAANGRLWLGPPGELVDIALDLQGTDQKIELKQLALSQRAGELRAHGNIAFKPQLAWQLQSQARNFNPGALAAQWPGDLSFALNTSGRLSNTGADGTLELKNLRGKLRKRLLSGQADLAFTSKPTLSGRFTVQSGNSRVDILGTRGNQLQATATIEVQSLDDWLPDAAGRLDGRVTARGKWPRLDFTADIEGHDLRVATARAESLAVQAQVANPKQPMGTAQLSLRNIGVAGFEFTSVDAHASGSQQAHTLQLTARGERLNGDLRMQGSQTADGWMGTVEQLVLDARRIERVALQSSAQISIAQGAVSVQQSCLAGAQLRLCAAFGSQADGRLEGSYSISNVQLALANAFLPTLPIALTGTVEGNGTIRRTAAGEFFGQAQITLPGGRIAAKETPDESLLDYSDLRLTADLAGRNAHATIGGRFADAGVLNGQVALAGLGLVDGTINGSVSADIPSLAPIAEFVPQLTDVKGRASLQASVMGRLEQPQISGELRATELALQVPVLGLKLVNGNVRVQPETNGDFSVDGELQSGDGKVSLGGRMTRDGHVRVTAKGERFLAANIPAARVTINPDLELTRDTQRMMLTGKVQIPTADIDISKLPQGQRAKAASPDVVVVDAPAADENAAASLPLNADINVELGDKVNVKGFGLETVVSGKLGVKEVPGMPTVGSGELTIAGTYKAYGQDLTIRRGRLLFAGTPLDNPQLDIEAVRTIEDENVTAGLRLTGTAQNPQTTVFSDPTMSQTEALAYLVSGKSLDSVGTSSSEGSALQTAALSLGTSGGGLLAKNIGTRLGADKVAIENNALIGGSTLTIGEYLSPRLYLSYGVGLFDPGEVVSVRYRLSKSFSVQAARGPNETRSSLEYRIER